MKMRAYGLSICEFGANSANSGMIPVLILQGGIVNLIFCACICGANPIGNGRLFTMACGCIYNANEMTGWSERVTYMHMQQHVCKYRQSPRRHG